MCNGFVITSFHRRTYEHLILKVSVKCFVILLVLIGIIGTAYAEPQALLTPFDVYLSVDDFTVQGPNHNILALDRGESATLTIHVKNNDDKPHQITLKDPKGPKSGLFETFHFEPEQITVMPHQTKSTQLHITISKDTHTHSSLVTFLGESDTFGMKGLGFFVVVDREINDHIDKSLRSGFPGGAFPHLNTKISESEAEKLIGSGFGIPEYLPLGYEFQGIDGSEDQQRFVYSPVNIDTETTVFSQFWNDGGLLIIYNVDGPNVNNTKALPIKVAQDEGQQIMINGMMGDAKEKQTRVVVESEITYEVPANVSFFDDVKKKSVHLRANMPLDELLNIASSIPILDELDLTYDEMGKSKQYYERTDPDPVLDLWNNHLEIIDGTIVSKTTYPGTGKGPTEFHVKVNKFFKPLSKNTESITLFASHADSNVPSTLNEGDSALIYIESGNQISKYSVKVDESTYCEPRDYIQIALVLPNDPNQLVRGHPTLPFDWKDQCIADYFTKDPNFWQYREYRPPMQQWKVHNIPIEDQRCSSEGQDFVSVQKIGNYNYKYCVKPESISKMIDRGWATNNENTSFDIITPESKLATFYAQPQITSVILKQDSTVRVHLFSYIKEPDGWDKVFDRIFNEVPNNFKIGIIEDTPQNLDGFVIYGKENTPSGIEVELLKENGYFVVYLTSDKLMKPGEYNLSVISTDKKGAVIQKPLFVTVVNPDTTSIQDNTVKLQFSKDSWGVNLENISESEYWFREDYRKPWPPSPILNITQNNIHPDVKEMIDVMWSDVAEYIPSEFDKEVLQVKVDKKFNADPQEIRDWLETTYVQQFKRNLDDSFSSYIKYDNKIYLFEFVIAD